MPPLEDVLGEPRSSEPDRRTERDLQEAIAEMEKAAADMNAERGR